MTDVQLALFVAKIKTVNGCWIWTAARERLGYGRFGISGRLWLSHRAAYEHFIGPIPADKELDHLCRNRACVNPCHLEPVTHGENVRRGVPHNTLMYQTVAAKNRGRKMSEEERAKMRAAWVRRKARMHHAAI